MIQLRMLAGNDLRVTASKLIFQNPPFRGFIPKTPIKELFFSVADCYQLGDYFNATLIQRITTFTPQSQDKPSQINFFYETEHYFYGV